MCGERAGESCPVSRSLPTCLSAEADLFCYLSSYLSVIFLARREARRALQPSLTLTTIEVTRIVLESSTSRPSSMGFFYNPVVAFELTTLGNLMRCYDKQFLDGYRNQHSSSISSTAGQAA